MRHTAIKISGAQTNYSNTVLGPLLSAKAAPEADPLRCNLRSPGSLELGPTGPTA